jgi:hypothetical protein
MRPMLATHLVAQRAAEVTDDLGGGRYRAVATRRVQACRVLGWLRCGPQDGGNFMSDAFIICQLYVVLFIALYDWFPLGSFSNRAGGRGADSTGRLFLVTVISALPYGHRPRREPYPKAFRRG